MPYPVYLAPEEMNKPVKRISVTLLVRGRHNYYTIIAGQIQIAPSPPTTRFEFAHQRLPALMKDEDSNWRQKRTCRCHHIFGLGKRDLRVWYGWSLSLSRSGALPCTTRSR